MQFEPKLQTGVVAILLALLAVASPVNSQVPDPQECLDGSIGPFPAPDATCLGDPPEPSLDDLCALNPEATDPTFPACLEGLSPPVGADTLCAVNPAPVDPTFPGCLQELAPPVGPEALDGLCAVNPEAVDPTFPGCLDDLSPPVGPEELDGFCALNPDAVDPTFPACVQELAPPVGAEALDGLCALNPEAVDPTFPGCLQEISPPGVDALDALCAFNPDAVDPTFPGCLQELAPPVDPSALDALCALPIADPEAEQTFPACLGTPEAPGAEALDALCALPIADPEAEQTFPACFGTPTPDPSILDALCALPVADPEANPVFPECLGGAPGGLPDGCDPSGEDFPQEECGVTVPEVGGGNTAPEADAGAAQNVDEGELVTLAGSATDADDDPLTYAWDCAGVTLTNPDTPGASFTAPQVDEDGESILCTLTVNDGTDDANSQTTINVADIPAVLDFVFVIDSLAAQPTENAVLVTGTATPSIDADDTSIAIALSSANGVLAGEGAQSIVWSEGNAQSLDLASGSPEAFEALVSWNEYEAVAWTITVASGAASDASDFTVTFAADATYIDFGAGNPPAVIGVGPMSQGSYGPDDSTSPDLATSITITDNNGAGDGDNADFGQIVDANVAAVLANGDDAADVDVTLPGVNQAGSPPLARDFAASVSLPPRLKDGSYILTASYTNPIADNEVGPADLTESQTKVLAVENVAPVIGIADADLFLGTERIAGADIVAFTVDDFNAGTLEGDAVTELTTLSVAVRQGSSGACTGSPVTQGLTIGFPQASGADQTGAQLDFSEVALDAALPVSVSLTWGTTALAGTYELCATLSDGDQEDDNVLLADFGLAAINGGFHVTIDDGGNGLAAPMVNPGQSSTTEALSMLFSGTTGASELVLTVGDFVRNPGGVTFTASSVSATICSTAVCDLGDELATATGSSGVVTFADVSAFALPGQEIFVVFQFSVPLGTPAGNYAAPITVAVEPA